MTGQSQNMETSHDMQVVVTGTAGISWRKKPVTVSETVNKNLTIFRKSVSVIQGQRSSKLTFHNQ